MPRKQARRRLIIKFICSSWTLDRGSPPNGSGNRFVNPTLEEKSEESESSEEDSSEVVAQADFAFFDPKPDDFHGAKILLLTHLDNKQWDLNGFVELILGQTAVGTVVKIEGNEDDGVFSLITALNLGRYKHKNADQKKGSKGDLDEAIVYIKPEDEIFHKLSSWSFSFPLHTRHVATDELRNYRLMGLVMAIKGNKGSIFRKELHTLIDEP